MRRVLPKSPSSFYPVILTFVLIAVCRIAVALIPDKINGYMGVSILILLIFLVPGYIHLMLGKSKGAAYFEKSSSLGKSSLPDKLSLRMIKPEHIFLSLSGALFLMSAGVLLDICFRGIYSSSESFVLYGTFAAIGDNSEHVTLYLIITYAAIPAICEEFLFRGVLGSREASLSSIFICSILYALLPFDPTLLPSALLTGLLLSFMLLITRSLPVCILVHFLYNVFGIFVRTNISDYYLSSSNNILLILVLVIVLLLSGAIFCAEAARNFAIQAKKKEPTLLCFKKEKASEVVKSTLSAFISPTGLISIVLYAAMFALDLLL